jgi:nicotinamide-nucleotide amidase
MRAEILTIGDELCRGEIVDTNSAYLARRLWDLDITTRWMTSCCDDEHDITTALALAAERADVIVCSGGLGPTEDDLTVDVVARLAGVEVVVDLTARERMEARFAGRIEVTPIQLRQVRVPAAARVYVNPAGLAPCFEIAVARPASANGGGDGAAAGIPVICLPGIPRELHAIFDAHLEARLGQLREAHGAVERIARRIYRVFGRGESQISQACRGIVDGVRGASIHYQVKFPETLVKLVVRDQDAAAATARLDAMDTVLRERLVGFVYGTGEENLVNKVTRRLIETGRTVATAESCTGGMIGELLTNMPGSSRAFKGGAIVYSNEEKERQLGVAHDTLVAHGAVSEPTVREMACGARERFGVELAVAVSGVAGPDGGTPDKPVGTVWLALASARGVRTKKLGWPGMRDQIRTLSAWWALKMIDEELDA